MLHLVTLLGVTALSSVPAGADQEAAKTLFGQPVLEAPALTADEAQRRADTFEQMLQERGWVQIGDQIRPADGQGGFAQPPAPKGMLDAPPHRATIFLNFFGAELSPGTNSALDESSCINTPTQWPGFGGTEQQALALIDVFERQMEPYGVRIAYDERPPSHLPYAMVMMGGSPQMLGLGSGVLGVSCSSDCADQWWRDTTFAFTDNINPNNAATLGTTALHEAAHAFGLAHIDNPQRIMNPFVGSADVTWADSCTPYNDATGGINCQPTHELFCDGQSAQNTHAELMAYFGENSPDVEPPVVEILSPQDGMELEPGSSVDVEVDVTDDHEGFGWRLVIPEVDQIAPAYTFQKKWQLSSLPEGVYTLRVEAIDHDRNEASDEVTIYVGVEPDPMEGESETDGGGTTGGDTDTGIASESGTGGNETMDGSDTDMTGVEMMDPDPKGCACHASAPGSRHAAWMWLGLLPLLATRRRRSA